MELMLAEDKCHQWIILCLFLYLEISILVVGIHSLYQVRVVIINLWEGFYFILISSILSALYTSRKLKNKFLLLISILIVVYFQTIPRNA